jgi:hypothetical protein
MPNTLNLLEEVRRRVPRGTDYAVAKALEMDQSHLAKVLCGKAGLGPIPVVRVSEILQRDLKDVLVLVEEDKAKTRKQREFWERRSPGSYVDPGATQCVANDTIQSQNQKHFGAPSAKPPVT